MLFQNNSRNNKKLKYIIQKLKNLTRKEFGSLEKNTPLMTHRNFGRASLNASFTVEAALVLPVFLYLTVGTLSFITLMGRAGTLESAIQDTAKQMAVYSYAVKNNGGEAGSLKGGVSAVYARSRLQKYTKGLKGFHLSYSAFLNENEEIDLVAAYRVSSDMPLFSFGNPEILQRGFVRAWTGQDFRKKAGNGNGTTGSKESVYVTENGSVYHKNLNCTHLRLSIRQVSTGAAAGLRNRYGAKYYACSCCKSGTGSTVYITNTGNRYHVSLSCSGLKRTIRSISVSEADNLPPCSKCGG